MKITCHSCGAKYTVSDEKVQGKTVKMKCRKCGATIVVGGAAQGEGTAIDDSAVSHAADGAPEGPPPGSFLVSVTESDQRTMTLAEVVEAYNGAVITADTYVFADGMSDWQALQDNETIVAALNEAAMVSQAVTNGSAGYAAQPAMAAAAPQQAYAQPVAARRDSGRKSQDLFGGGGGYGADSGAGLSASGSLGSQSSPGKRDENSVLFSLNALTAATAPAARPSATTATKEDSGLIDLKALSANAPAAPQVAASAPMVDAVGMFPLGAPVMAPQQAPQAGYAVPTAAAPSGGSKLGLIIGGVIAVCAVAIVFLLVLRGDDKKPETASKKDDSATTATATATATVTATASAPTTATAVASSDETASASASASAVAQVPGKGWKGVPKGTGKATSGAPTTTAGGPKTPAKGACGCAPSDLNCALKCSVGKK